MNKLVGSLIVFAVSLSILVMVIWFDLRRAAAYLANVVARVGVEILLPLLGLRSSVKIMPVTSQDVPSNVLMFALIFFSACCFLWVASEGLAIWKTRRIAVRCGEPSQQIERAESEMHIR
jgi:hypothetical protein